MAEIEVAKLVKFDKCLIALALLCAFHCCCVWISLPEVCNQCSLPFFKCPCALCVEQSSIQQWVSGSDSASPASLSHGVHQSGLGQGAKGRAATHHPADLRLPTDGHHKVQVEPAPTDMKARESLVYLWNYDALVILLVITQCRICDQTSDFMWWQHQWQQTLILWDCASFMVFFV